MDGGTVIKKKVKTCKGQDVVDGNDRLRPEVDTAHKEEYTMRTLE